MLKGSALVAALIGFLATCAALIAWWDSAWQEAMSPYHQVRSISHPPLHLWRADMVVVAISRASRDISEDAAP